jgi:hypothetical protein
MVLFIDLEFGSFAGESGYWPPPIFSIEEAG